MQSESNHHNSVHIPLVISKFYSDSLFSSILGIDYCEIVSLNTTILTTSSRESPVIYPTYHYNKQTLLSPYTHLKHHIQWSLSLSTCIG